MERAHIYRVRRIPVRVGGTTTTEAIIDFLGLRGRRVVSEEVMSNLQNIPRIPM